MHDQHQTELLHIHLILSAENSGWIIQKMAERIAEFAGEFGTTVTISDQIDPEASVNHWMSYAFANVPQSTPATMMITHLDDPYKIRLVQSELQNGIDIGICISSHHREFLCEQGVDASMLAFVVPGHDFVAKPRRIVVGLTTRLYPDGRKREFMLEKLASKISLDSIRFRIFGAGWEKMIPKLESAGAVVDYFPGTDDYTNDYLEMVEAIPNFDYYLYLGRDEGSLGTLDALSAGVKTIITPQGFHCDLPGGISHPFWEQEELEAVFQKIIEERTELTNAVARFSWREYSRQHILLWRSLHENKHKKYIAQAMTKDKSDQSLVTARHESRADLFLRLLSYRRILSAISHLPFLHGLRKWWRTR
ncbi:glycosyltransferase [Parasphingorhabdus cellanae]|uniref:Glycosyltransferase n=1 Tax=Parasphingorhabdus cellanae TaxID=2806553 RepID=A0ABX7T441_9SPHN|nr:glycosyltransferase [Parasphingorhabdus cellanae]QTD54852.1 glycosyltransferase [Parasphingorhabdus cellanae]